MHLSLPEVQSLALVRLAVAKSERIRTLNLCNKYM